MIHESVKIHPTARIACEHIEIGEGGIIGANCAIEGHKVEIGRDLWMDEGASIGGGSCHDTCAYLKAGDFLHMGKSSQINTARGVTIGDEVGLGIQTQIFTHGAYLNELNGFPVKFAPVKIGSNVWIPNALVNPGVSIGDNVVVAAQSLINKDLPSGCLAAGSPAKVIREFEYPKNLTPGQKQNILINICTECNVILRSNLVHVVECYGLSNEETIFDCESYKITGPITKISEIIRNQLRRHGIRFRYSVNNNTYQKWEENDES